MTKIHYLPVPPHPESPRHLTPAPDFPLLDAPRTTTPDRFIAATFGYVEPY